MRPVREEMKQFVVTEGGVSYYAAPKVIVGIAIPGELPDAGYYVLQIIFRPNGSLYLSCPRFYDSNGILSRIELGADGSLPAQRDLMEHGKQTSHLVKLHHPPDGNAHFSQHDKIVNKVGRAASFPLGGPIGKLFHLHAFLPANGFARFTDAELYRNRPNLIFPFARVPEAITISGEWHRKKNIRDLWAPAGQDIGPKVALLHRPTGEKRNGCLIGRPPRHGDSGHVLVLFCHSVRLPDGIERPTMILDAGMDSDEVPVSGMAARPSARLMWMYPVVDPKGLAEQIGSVDYHPRPEASDYHLDSDLGESPS